MVSANICGTKQDGVQCACMCEGLTRQWVMWAVTSGVGAAARRQPEV